jgi:MFS family permease
MEASSAFGWGSIPKMHTSSLNDVNRPTAILSVTAFGVIGSIVFLLLPLLIGGFTEELSLNTRQVGWLGSADMIGMFAAAVVATYWIRRTDWRMVALLTSSLLVLCHLLSGWVTAYEVLLAIRVVAGFAGGSMMSIALTCLGDTRNPDRYFALFISGQLGLGSVGLLVLPGVIEQFGLNGAFLSLAVLSGLAIAVIPFIPRHGDFAAPEKVSGIPLRKMLPGSGS